MIDASYHRLAEEKFSLWHQIVESYSPNLWTRVTGHVQDDQFEEAAREKYDRELKEHYDQKEQAGRSESV